MQLKSDPHIFSGMQRDISVSKHKPETLYDAMNLRFTPRDGDTMLSITNEKGTTQLQEDNINIELTGMYLGHCVINDYVVVFTHNDTAGISNPDHIYKITPLTESTADVDILYEGNLGFRSEFPIETLGVYENKDIQKVYWVDGNKQPRMINVANVKHSTGDDEQFDFVARLNLNEVVTVERYEGRGIFAPGTIQYAFSYYNKYGRQSNIFYTTLLNYISYPERGGKPDESIANCFKINITGLQTDFDYLRVYSIHRTSYNTVPTVKKVIDIELDGKTSTSFIDDGQLGETVDPTELLYIGGEMIKAKTLTQKDNTLFFANLELIRPSIDQTYKELICAVGKNESEVNDILKITETTSEQHIKLLDSSNSYYKYCNNLNGGLPGFKNREHYRIGVQFQHKSGKWSEPVFIGDYTLDNVSNNPSLTFTDNDVILRQPTLRLNLLINNGNTGINLQEYIKVRPLVVFPTIEDRLVLTQGVLCPTVFSKSNRENSSPFSQASWFFRPSKTSETVPLFGNTDMGSYAAFRHLECLSDGARLTNCGVMDYKSLEIQGGLKTLEESTGSGDKILILEKEAPKDKQFFIDQSIVTMHSPDIEWDEQFDFLNYTDWKLRIVGASIITANCSDVDIQTSSPQNLDAEGFSRQRFNTSDSYYGGGMFISGLLWEDYIVQKQFDKDTNMVNYSLYGENDSDTPSLKYKYLVYPWQKSGSLNNDENREGGATKTAELKYKKMSNLRFSEFNQYFTSQETYDISQLQLFSSDQMSLLKLPLKNKATAPNIDINYYGNVDTLLSGNLDDIIISDNEFVENCATLRSKDIVAKSGSFIDSKKNAVLYSTSTPVRMKYKSGRHFVFGLTPDEDKSVNILPRVVRAPDDSTSGERGNYSYNMFWIDKQYISAYGGEIDGNTVTPIDIFENKNHYLNMVDKLADNTTIVLLKGGLNGDTNEGPVLATTSLVNGEHVITGLTAQLAHFYIGPSYDHAGNIAAYECYMKDAYAGSPYGVFKTDMPNMPESDPQQSVVMNPFKVNQRVISNSQDVIGCHLLLGELYREPSDQIWNSENYPYFNGKTEEATKSNLWIPAGEPIRLDNAQRLTTQGGNTYISIDYTQGDTWYTRYDCLKTYAFTPEDENQVIEIGSFLCESRINADGRYDRNRGQMSNLNMSPINFNLLNNAYNNKDNFFNYRILDKDYYTLNVFDNQITWSKEKQLAADVDLWTNVTMASTFDLDGTMGPINALRTWKDTIYCFQDNAVSVISFNPRVQIPTSDGVPIEISNSYKLEGKIYISDTIGCKNKQTIAVTPSGVYFIDDNSKELYNLAGQQLTNISTSHSMSHWFKNNTLDKVFYDSNRNDLYIENQDDCLVYSEIIGQFTSFMSYNNTPAMFNIGSKFYAFRDENISNLTTVHSLFTGEYNRFFGHYKPIWFEFISNADSSLDKIFSTLETRVDFKDADTDVPVFNKFFDTIKVTTEYQNSGDINLSFNRLLSSNVKKKFRIWRVDIPRDSLHKFDRIRNTWARIKLYKHNDDVTQDNNKMELHDLSVQYFI